MSLLLFGITVHNILISWPHSWSRKQVNLKAMAIHYVHFSLLIKEGFLLYLKNFGLVLKKQGSLRKKKIKKIPRSTFPVKAETFHRIFITETNSFSIMTSNSFSFMTFITAYIPRTWQQLHHKVWQSLVFWSPSQVSVRKSHYTTLKSKWGGGRERKVIIPGHIWCFPPGMVPATIGMNREMSCISS